ncbi:MAG: hypothetical protein MI785_06865 [Kiloniellales bacterium]|nr:hypothetical protein [Kiloniellales bacterium]
MATHPGEAMPETAYKMDTAKSKDGHRRSDDTARGPSPAHAQPPGFGFPGWAQGAIEKRAFRCDLEIRAGVIRFIFSVVGESNGN